MKGEESDYEHTMVSLIGKSSAHQTLRAHADALKLAMALVVTL
jgi:hypothetical protein